MPKHSGAYIGVVLLLLLMSAMVVFAQEELTETFVSSDGTISFNYPDGWTVDTTSGFITLSSPTGQQPFVMMMFVDPTFTEIFAPDADTPTKVLKATADTFSIGSDIAEIDLEGRQAALGSLDNETGGSAVAIEFDEGGFGLVLAFGNFDNETLTTVAEIAVSFNSPSEGQTSTPILGNTDDKEPGKSLNSIVNFAGEWRDVIAELEEEQAIASGGSLVFNEDYAFFSGQGDWFTALASRSPFTDIVMSAEITYEIGSTSQFETCSLMSRIETDSQGTATRYLEVGLDNELNIFYFDLFGNGEDDSNYNTATLDIDLDEPHHILYIASGDTITVYFDGELIFEDELIDERSGSYGIALRGRGAGARCEGRNIWVYQAPAFEPGVCKISALNNVNKRSGPGTDFAQAGQLQAGRTLSAIGQAEDSSGKTWWQLEDETWVREDVVNALGDCRSLPEAD